MAAAGSENVRGLSFLHAWELGAGLGHIGVFVPLAKRLLTRGHRVHLAARDTGTVGEIARQTGAPLLQAPFLTESRSVTPPLSYPDILLRFGLGNPKLLQGHVAAWRSLLELTQTDLVVADHAPTALIAARSAGIPVMLFNSGFFVPPRETPLPGLRDWEAPAREQLIDIELRLLDAINQCLGSYGKPPLGAAWELFDVAEPTLLGFPEFDHYDRRGRNSYWGYVGNADMGGLPEWPQCPGKKIFAYLRSDSKHFAATIQALINARQPTLLYCPDLTAEAKQAVLAQAHLRLSTAPLNIGLTAREADLLVSYAAFSTTCSFIHAGKPCLLVPNHLEQFLFARRVAAGGFGVIVPPEPEEQNIDARLHEVMHNPIYRNRCLAFGQRYAAFPQNTVLDNLERRMVQLAGSYQPRPEPPPR